MKEARKILMVVSIVIAIGVTSGFGSSDYPNKPVELVVPYGPGGPADMSARAYKDYVSKILGQPIILTFKPGAGGAIGSAFVANTKPDGYTFLVGSNSGLVVAPLTKKPGYTLSDFTPICSLSLSPLCWTVRDDSPYKTMQDFIRAAKMKKLTYATYGTLTAAHVCMEALGKIEGFQAIHVPYEGAAKAHTAVLGGHADIGIASGSSGMVGPGRLRIVAIAYKERLDILPDVPTLKEMGYPTIYGTVYYSLWGPKGVSKEIANKIYEAHKRAAKENGKEISKALSTFEEVMLVMSSDEIMAEYQTDYEFSKKMLQEMGALQK